MRRFLLFVFILIYSFTQGQTQRLTGKVTSAAEPSGMPGVTVVVKGTTTGTITDVSGGFSLDVPSGATLEFSFVGYTSQRVIYTGQPTISILLEEQTSELGEIVVVGYSSMDKKDITGAVTTISADKLKDLSVNGLDQALQGQAPGVQVTQSSGTPGGGVSVRIRGVTSISAGSRPLYVIDGIPVETGALSSRDFG
ncbi:MAG TPA: carboxypeptidase-like regulatory domain-containing protein, partial [Cyclobacteriaceae bacterium]|nr:carboxypeptidase-like regulatory domain-containing protein [Cyclobacteriaceae bacterium]